MNLIHPKHPPAGGRPPAARRVDQFPSGEWISFRAAASADLEVFELEAASLVAQADAAIRRRMLPETARRDPLLTEAETRALARARTAVRMSAQPVSQWHYRRALGALGRIEAVVTCEEGDEIEVTCRECKVSKTRGVRCANRLVCRSCREVLASRYRQRFAAARSVLLVEARDLGLLSAPKNSLRRL